MVVVALQRGQMASQAALRQHWLPILPHAEVTRADDVRQQRRGIGRMVVRQVQVISVGLAGQVGITCRHVIGAAVFAQRVVARDAEGHVLIALLRRGGGDALVEGDTFFDKTLAFSQ